jgi:predicted Rossmann-fold nucleotide-binding protein
MFDYPVVLLGTDYWMPLRALIQERLMALRTIDPADANIMLFTDSPSESASHLFDTALKDLGPAFGQGPAPSKLLGERGL